MAEATASQQILSEIRPPQGAQLDFIRSGALVKKFQAGQGGGKTVAGVFEVRRYVKRWPGAIVICTEPTYPMVRDILRVEFDRQFAASGEDDRVEFRVSEGKYRLSNGAEIWLRQCDQADRLRGPSVAAVWMDEAGQSPYTAFQILAGRVRQHGYPHLMLFTGTPRGRNWFHWCFERGDRPDGAPPYLGTMLQQTIGEEPEQFRWGSLQNPYLDPVTKGLLQSAYPPGTPMYRQEVLGETINAEGLVYQHFDPDRHVQYLPQELDQSAEPLTFVRTVIGVDWGWANPGVLLVGAMAADGCVWILDEVYETERSIGWWAEQATRLQAAYQPESYRCDPAEPANIAQLSSSGLPAAKANNEVLPGITAVAGLISNDKLRVHPRCLNTIREFAAYSWKERKGESVPDEPDKCDDHTMDALRYLVMAMIRPSGAGIATGHSNRSKHAQRDHR